MVKKSLLGFALMLGAISLNAAPVLQESFDGAQTKAETEPGYYEFINSQDGDSREVVDGAVVFVNDPATVCDGQAWQRAIKFRNLDLQEGKLYKMSFQLKGTNRYNKDQFENADDAPRCQANFALMQGEENADIALVGADGKEQSFRIERFNEEAYETYSSLIFFAGKDANAAAYTKSTPLVDKFFATINVMNPGTFYIDNVLVEEGVAVESVVFNQDAIRVKYAFDTNIAELAKKAPAGRLILPAECAKVFDPEGTELVVEDVEYMADGYVYIFLAEDSFEDEEVKLTVSFTNPTGDNEIISPAGPKGETMSFVDVEASYDDSFEATSWGYTPAELVSSTPADGSFNLNEDINEFSFTFDHMVCTGETDNNDAPKAVLKNKTLNFSENLIIKPGQDETVSTIVFVRPEGSTPLVGKKGMYTITVSGITTSVDQLNENDMNVSFEVGKVKVAETVYGEATGVWVEGAAYKEPQPTNGWTAYFNGELATDGGQDRVCSINTNGKGCGYYLCQRGGSVAAEITYGEKADEPFTLEAGNYQFDFYLTMWDNKGGSATYTLKDAVSGTVVATGNLQGTVNTPVMENGTMDMNTVAPLSVKIDEVPAGKYILSLTQSAGWNGTILYGFEYKTYTMTEGEKDETVAVAEGKFTDVPGSHIPDAGSGWRIIRGDGRYRTPGATVSWGADCTDATGGGGPRIFDLSYQGMGGKGIYLAGDKATYGEFLTYEDAEGVEQPEKILSLDKAKYEISYNCALWKAEGVKMTLKIFRQEDGINGSPVYTREDVITGKSPQGSQGDASVEAMPVQFFWTAPAEGNYILQFQSNGEAFVGNVLVKTTASMAVQYTNMLRAAMEPAKAEYAKAMAKDEYQGTTRTTLGQKIEEYTAPEYTTIAEYENAISTLGDLVKASKARRENIDAYPGALQGILDGMTAAQGTKYENLEQFPIVEACYNDYNGVDPVQMTDEELATAVARMGDTGTLLKNMVNDCVPFLTKQITELAAMVVGLDAEEAGCGYIIAAGQAISDDQDLVATLKKAYAAKLYKKIASGENIFEIYHEAEVEGEEPWTEETSINVDAMIQNRGFYTTAQKQATGAFANENSWPGWEVEKVKNDLLADWGWGGPYNCTPVRPVSDASCCTAWDGALNVKQTITNIPVGIYTVGIGVGDGTPDSNPNASYAFALTEQMDEPLTEYAQNNNGNRGTTAKEFPGIVADVNGNLASVTVGASLTTKTDFAQADNATLVMTGIVEEFDYAKAAAELSEEIADAVEEVLQTIEGEPVKVQLYNIDATPAVKTVAGKVYIKVATYANGQVVVSKFAQK